MSLWVKLCGMGSVEDVRWAAETGADAIGIVLTPSPRRVDLDLAGHIVENAPKGLTTVAVFYRPAPELLVEVRNRIPFDLIQAESESLVGIDGIVSFPVVHDQENIDDAIEKAVSISGNGLVLVEGVGRGGQGRSPDYIRVSSVMSRGAIVIAGGLTPANVAGVIEKMKPAGVDVSSGIESAPGVKDPALMARFVEAARAATREVAK